MPQAHQGEQRLSDQHSHDMLTPYSNEELKGAMALDEEVVEVSGLHMDRKNPRAGFEEFETEDQAIERLIASADIDEIVRSIQSIGWIDFEPLIVEKNSNIVLEGNRRLAALRLLTDSGLRQRLEYNLPKDAGNAAPPKKIRVRFVSDRKEARSFIAFKHINGPAKWDAFAKARYAKEWLDEGATIENVSNAVGDNHSTVLRLVNGLAVFNQATKLGFDKADITAKSFNFSHLYTALARPSVRKYLGLTDEVAAQLPENPVPEAAQDNLQELMGWLYGQSKQKREHIIRSQNPDLGKLVKVLAEPRAMKILIKEKSLRLAFDEVEPPASRFEDSLRDSAISAERTLGLLSHFNPDTQQVLMDTVDRLATSVRLIRNGMREKTKQDDDL